MTTLKSHSVHTRKPHECTGCCKTLPVGEFAHFWVGIWDGDFQSNYFCMSCQMYICSKLCDHDWYEGEIPIFKREFDSDQFER